MLAMDSPGVTVRPIRQMSGGSSFNEVFFSDVRIPDSHTHRRCRRGLARRAHDARIRTPVQRFRSWRQHRRRILRAAPRLRPLAGSHRRSGDATTPRRCIRPRAGARARRRTRRRPRPADGGRPGSERVDRQAAVDEVDDSSRRGRRRAARTTSARPTPASGARMRGRSRCSVRPAIGSPAAATRSSATSSPIALLGLPSEPRRRQGRGVPRCTTMIRLVVPTRGPGCDKRARN